MAALLMSGTKACQTDYELGAQTDISPTPTPTATIGDDDDDDFTDDDDDDGTPTPTNTATGTPTATASASPTATAGTLETSGPAGFLQALAGLDNTDADLEEAPPSSRRGASTSGQNLPDRNWLGNIYNDDSGEEARQDTDGDGYTDRLEADSGTDATDATSTPPAPVTWLKERLLGLDDDGDGLKNQEEGELGSNPNRKDSDGDGVTDGAEKLSSSDPTSAVSKLIDSDGDGLGDSYETTIGTNTTSPDTDRDGLQDAAEIAVGADPMQIDSDHDGILDGKEVELGADPIRAEPNFR